MKKFSQFINETRSLASIQGRRLGLVPDGHGSYHDKNTGEFIAKNVGGRLKFYNQNQVVGGQDPPQKRTPQNQRPVATQNPNFSKKSNVKTESAGSKDQDKILREKYISGEILTEGSFVHNLKTNQIGKIVRRGTNHIICVTEEDEMFKSWIHDVVEVSSHNITRIHKGSDIEIPSKNLKKIVKSAINRKDDNIDGFVDKDDKKVGPYGAFIPQAKNTPKFFRKEWTEISGVPANQREIGTDSLRDYTMKMADTKKIRNFINKYKAKNKH